MSLGRARKNINNFVDRNQNCFPLLKSVGGILMKPEKICFSHNLKFVVKTLRRGYC